MSTPETPTPTPPDTTEDKRSVDDAPSAPVAKARPRPPRAERIMAIVRWVMLAVVASVALGTWVELGMGDTGNETQSDRYYCPMHTHVRSPDPGTCPICGMQLVPIPDHPAGAATTGSVQPTTQPPARAVTPPTASSSAESGPSIGAVTDVMLTPERRQAIGVSVTTAREGDIARTLRLPAVVEVPQSAISEVHVRVPAFVEQVAPLEVGMKVKAGQPLAWVYAPDASRATSELIAAQAIADSGRPGDQQLVDAARQRLRAVGVSKSEGDMALKRGTQSNAIGVYARTSGVITARDISLGGFVSPETRLFQIADLSKLWVSATVSIEDAARLPPGTQATLAIGRSGRKLDTEVLLIEPTMETETRTATLRLALKNDDQSVLPGEIGEVVVRLTTEPRILVPRDAVIDLGARRYVFIETAPGMFSPRSVEIGPLVDGERVILSGLSKGDAVVTRGAFLLDSESRLTTAALPGAQGTP